LTPLSRAIRYSRGCWGYFFALLLLLGAAACPGPGHAAELAMGPLPRTKTGCGDIEEKQRLLSKVPGGFAHHRKARAQESGPGVEVAHPQQGLNER